MGGRRLGGWITGSLWVASGCTETRGPPEQPWIIPYGEDGGDASGDADSGNDGEASSAGEGASADGSSGGEAGTDPADDANDAHEDGGLEDSGGIGESSTGDAPTESPYMGGWDVGNCQDSIVPGSGVLSDISLSDQYGESVRFYDFCHKAILITDGSFW